MSVTKADVTAENRYLTTEEQQKNAEYVYTFLSLRGWSFNAICAILGNMESESGINPSIYENLDNTSDTNGYGLVQWTPNTKYKEWADDNGYTYEDIDGQLTRLDYELMLNIQYIPTDNYPLSFAEFKKSTLTPEYLAQAFLLNYERPKEQDQPTRSTQARAWYNYLTDKYPVDKPPEASEKRRGLSKLLFFYAGIKR